MSFTTTLNPFAPVLPLQAASRFDPYFDVYGLSLKEAASGAQRAVTLIARSPASPVAQALAINLARFEPGSIEIGIIFAQIVPEASLEFLLQALQNADVGVPENIIRWAKNRALLDAHERLTLGCALCWTGDTMRRTEDTRSPFERVDDVNPVMLAEAHASFSAMWKASKPLPKGLLTSTASVAPGNQPRNPPPSIDRSAAQLDDYLRNRRH